MKSLHDPSDLRHFHELSPDQRDALIREIILSARQARSRAMRDALIAFWLWLPHAITRARAAVFSGRYPMLRTRGAWKR